MNFSRLFAFLLLAIAVFGCGKRTDPSKWTYTGDFHSTIKDADRIVIRDGGYNCCNNNVDGQLILAEIVDPKEISLVYDNIVFNKRQETTACMCCGNPGVDWYQGTKRLALTSIQHVKAIRWCGFPTSPYGDAKLTEASSTWIASWLSKYAKPKDNK